MKRIAIALLLACVLLACSACNPASDTRPSATPPSPPEDIVANTAQPSPDAGTSNESDVPQPPSVDLSGAPTLRWLILASGIKPNDYLPITELSEATRINIALDYVAFPFLKDADPAIYRRYYDEQMARGSYDLVTLDCAFFSPDQWAADGLFADLTDMLEPYVHLRDATTDIAMQLSQVGGRNYVLPVDFPNDLNNQVSHLIMHASASAADGGPIATLDDFIEAMAADPLGRQDGSIALSYTTLNEFRRGYDAFPFSVSHDLLFLFDAQGGVSAYPGSEVFAEDRRFVSRLRDVTPNPFQITSSAEMWHVEDPFPGAFAVGAGSASGWDDPDAKLVQIAPEKPQIYYNLPYGSYVHAVPSNAPGDIALAFLDAVYGNDVACDIALRGKYRVEYTIDAGRGYLRTGFSPTLSRFLADLPRNLAPIKQPIVNAMMRTGYDLQPMPWNGFVFDPTPVKQAYDVLVKRIMAGGTHLDADFEHITLSISGVLPDDDPVALNEHVFGNTSEKELAAFLLELEMAGLPMVLEECRAQYEAYLRIKRWK